MLSGLSRRFPWGDSMGVAVAVFVGVLTGTIGAFCLSVVQYLVNSPAIYGGLRAHWHLVPIGLGLVAALLHVFVRIRPMKAAFPLLSRSSEDTDLRAPIADIFETYHFGAFRNSGLTWVVRGTTSLLAALFGGIFGIEGAIVELSFATMPMFLRERRLLEEKQIFAICGIASSLGVALGAPFTGFLVGLELFMAVDPMVRWGAIVSSLVAFGVSAIWQGTLLSTVFTETSTEMASLMGTLFSALKPLTLSAGQWFLLSLGAVVVGLGCALLSAFTSRTLTRGGEFFTHVFGKRIGIGMLFAGALIGLSVWLVPESLTEPWRLADDVAWLRLSSPAALAVLIGMWGILVIAFSGWGSSGLFSPVLVLGALLGYVIGNSVSSVWALPLAIAGAAAMLSAMFRVPVAGIALVLEIGHVGTMWWLGSLAVMTAFTFARIFEIRPIHELLLERRGLRLIGARAANILSRLKTNEAMYRDVRTVQESASLTELKEAVATSNHAYLAVTAMDGKYLGLLSLEILPQRIQQVISGTAKEIDTQAVDRVFELRALIASYYPTVSPNDSLEKTLLALQEAPCVAVLDEARTFLGLVFESSVTTRYRRELAGLPSP